MKLLEKFLALSRARQITLVVCSIHFFALLGLVGHHLATRRLKPPRPMVVKTIAFSPPQKTIVSAPAAVAAAAPPTTVAPAAPAKPSAPSKKPSAPKAKPIAKKGAPTTARTTAPAKEERLLKEIAKSLETLNSEATQTRPTLTIPSKIGSKTQITPSKIDPTYGELLIAFLENALDLPEYGEVKVKIEIDSFGKLIDCEILEAKSSKNSEFLKTRLPELAFPYINEASRSFTITFRNEETR